MDKIGTSELREVTEKILFSVKKLKLKQRNQDKNSSKAVVYV